MKTEKKKFGLNLVGSGSPEGLEAAFKKGQDLLGKTNDAIKTAHDAAGGLKFVKNDLGKGASDKAMSLLKSKISGLPELNDFIPNPEDLADQTEILSGNKALTAKTKVAKAINVTFQQIQKYEKGTNGVSSNRLMQLSNYLKVPITYFFEDFRSFNDIKNTLR